MSQEYRLNSIKYTQQNKGQLKRISKYILYLSNNGGPRWHSGQGAVLQIGRSLVRSQMVSLEFFIDIMLAIALRPWGRLSL